MGVFLVVDDEVSVERLILQRFRKEVKAGEFEFLFAHNGQEALELLKEHPQIDAVISDINMPHMDGLTLLAHIQELNPVTKTIMISAYGDMENIRTSMNRGAFDFIVKPINFEDLRATLDKTVRAVQEIRQSLKQLEENQMLKMYVNPAVIQYMDLGRLAREDAKSNRTAVAESHDNSRIEATVCFVDICGFTALSEVLTPDIIAGLLNEYFDIFAQHTLEQKGAIDKFIGDAALLLFEGESHMERAARTVLNILSEIAPKTATHLAGEYFYPDVSAGINCGEMIAGNFGSKKLRRLDYTVIGDTVNTAARIETLAKPGQILTTMSGVQALNGCFSIEPNGAYKVYNKQQPVHTFAIKALQEKT